MRELKFRVWEEREKAYNTWSYILDTIGNLFRNAYGALIGCDKKDYIVEQYTGLKDKNGKEIYEGDIIKMPDWQVSPRTGIVKYHKAGFDPFQEGCRECWAADGEEVEVIGNIHENKELLDE